MEIEKKTLSPALAQIKELLKDDSKYVVCQTAPACRVSLGEMFNNPIGTKVTGKMVNSLKKLGFKGVFDTNFGADVTIWEESNEFYNRVKNNGPFPMFTSCCSGWLNMACRMYKDPVITSGLISTVKAPIGCLGAIIKTYYASKINVDPKNIVVVAFVPCVLKTQESNMPFNKINGMKDVDICLTTKDLANLIIDADIDFNSLEDAEFDNPLGESSGGAVIFGRSGGVLESSLRNAIYMDKKEVFSGDFNFKQSTLSPDIMEAKIDLAGKELLVCHTGSMGVKKIIDLAKQGNCPYNFVEVMACPGGCIMGGGQPVHLPKEGVTPIQVRQLRAKGLNDIDSNQKIRVPALNESVIKLYNDYFDSKPGSSKAEEVLHRDYSIQ